MNTILGRLTLDPVGMHCPSWDDAFVSSSSLNCFIFILFYFFYNFYSFFLFQVNLLTKILKSFSSSVSLGCVYVFYVCVFCVSLFLGAVVSVQS